MVHEAFHNVPLVVGTVLTMFHAAIPNPAALSPDIITVHINTFSWNKRYQISFFITLQVAHRVHAFDTKVRVLKNRCRENPLVTSFGIATRFLLQRE